MRSPWWSRATTDARLAQVRGGHEAGLTRADIAALLGTSRENVTAFAAHHGIGFADARRNPRRRPVADNVEPETLGVEPLDKMIARLGL